jgi:hypothetical protein
VAFAFHKLTSGVYRVVPTEELKNGEFAFLSAPGTAAGAGGANRLFDFGTDVH